MFRERAHRPTRAMAWPSVRVGVVVCVAALLAACGGPGAGEIGAVDLGTDIVVADLDGDGRAEVLALSHQFGDQPVEGRLSVWRRDSAGALSIRDSVTFGCYPWTMTLADVDGDGRKDLLVTDVGAWNCSEPGSGDALYLLRQDPQRPGRFLPPRKLAEDVHAYQAAVADLNGDGAPDVAFGELLKDSSRLLILFQDAREPGRFAPVVEVPAPGAVSEIVAGDVDGDGRADLFYIAYGAPSGYVPNTWLVLATQRADGSLAPPTLLSSQTGVNAQRLAILDLDGDGRLDLLAHLTPFSTDFGPFLRALRQGPAPLVWSAPIDSGLNGVLGVDGTDFGDIDEDGRPDLVLAGSWPVSGGPYAPPEIRSRVNLLPGRGDGSFAHAAGIDVGQQPDAVAIGDLDGDGRNDIVLHDGRTVWWMRQSPAAPGTFGAPQALP
jgi:hypothetical protein